MHLPESLQKAIENETNGISIDLLSKATEQLSKRYRLKDTGKSDAFMSDDILRTAYIAYRMPATYAAVAAVLQKTKERMPNFEPHSILDLGSGPGSALWAACSTFDTIQLITAIERDENLIAAGKRLSKESEFQSLRSANWICTDLTMPQNFTPHDLVILSYSLGELDSEAQRNILTAAWQSTTKALVLVEPGTPAGFKPVLLARTYLLELGGHIVAPCTHANACPMKGGDWCHFSERLARSHLHRKVKGAELGYEDEKYSYIVFSKTPCEIPNQGRILRHPDKHSGHINFTLCTAEGLVKKTISRKLGETYKSAKKKEWGDILEVNN